MMLDYFYSFEFCVDILVSEGLGYVSVKMLYDIETEENQ